MADNGQGAYLEAAFHGNMHPTFGEAPKVHLNQAVLARGKEPMRAGELMSAKAPTAGERRGQRGTLESAFDKNGDPAVTGDFETNPYAGTGLISNMIYGAGKLSDAGKRQEADYNILKQGQTLYAQALMQGASQQQAAQHALKALGTEGAVTFLSALMSHPSSPLASAGAFHNFLAGNGLNTPTEAFGPVTKEGQQIVQDPNTGEALRAQDVPGFKSAESEKFHQPIIKQDAQGNYKAIDPRHPEQALPIATPGPEGPQQFTGPLTAKQQAAAAGSAIPGADGLGPQIPITGTPTGSKSEDRLTMRQLPAIASAVGLMEDIKQKASGVLGLVRGPLASWVGQYAGSNPVAASIRADMDNLNSLSSALQGSVYAGAIKSMQESYATANDAPSFIRTQLTKSQDMLRSQGQAAADNVGQTRGVAVPQQLANQLEGAGIIPLGYQTPEEFQKLGPQATGEWKLRNGFQNNITDNERKAVYEAAQRGDYGPAPDPSQPIGTQNIEPMAGHVFNMYQSRQTQKQAQAQQAAAPQAAAEASKSAQVKATADGAAQASQQAAQEMAQPQPPASPESINPPKEGEATPGQLITNGHVPGVTANRGQGTPTPFARQLVAAGVNMPRAEASSPTFAPGVQPGGQPAAAAAAPSITQAAKPVLPPTPAQVNQVVSTQATTPQPAPAPLRAQPAPQGTSGTDAEGNPYATAPITPYQPPPGVTNGQ